MPFPVAHGLIGATVVAALLPSSRSRIVTPLLLGAFLGISPDFDYALNWLRIGRGGWHHGFTHSLPFALLIGIVMMILLREWKARSVVVFTGAFASHTLLDYLLTESQGVALWWPFTDHRYKLRLPNPIDYTWDDSSFWETAMDVFKIVATELLIFVPVLVIVLLLRRVVVKRSRSKQPVSVSVSLLVFILLSATPAFSQDKQRVVHWPEIPFHANAVKSVRATSPWQVLEHMRLAQWDILDFSRDAEHVSPEFPKGYWPKPDEPGTPASWQQTINAFRNDHEQMQALVEDPATDLHAKIPHGDGQTILREALVLADHNAYHLGVLAVMARILKANPEK